MPSAFSLPWSAAALLLGAGAAGYGGGRWAHLYLRRDGPVSSVGNLPPPGMVSAVPKRTAPPDSAVDQWMARARNGGGGDFAALMDGLDGVIKKEEDYFLWSAAQSWLLSLWLDKDLAGAARYVAGRLVTNKEDVTLGSTFGSLLGETDPVKLKEILSGPLKDSLGEYFVKAAMRSMATARPRDFLAWDMEGTGDAWTRNWSRAVAALAAVDSKAAAEVWLADGGGNTHGLAAIAGAMAERNPAEARAWVESLESPEARRTGRHIWISTLAKRDPQAALRELSGTGMDLGTWEKPPTSMTFPPTFHFADARKEVLAALAGQDPRAALEGWRTLETAGLLPKADAGKTPVTDLSRAIAEAAASRLPGEPGELLKALAAWRSGDADASARDLWKSLGMEMLRARSKAWTPASTLEAAGLILSGPDSGDYGGLVNQFLGQAAREDPARTAAFVGGLPENLRGEAAAHVIHFLDAAQSAFMRETLDTVPAEDWQPFFGTKLALEAAENADFIAGLPRTPKTDLARSQFANEWGRKDPAAAGQWVASLPPDGGSAQAARGLADAWGRYDETAASAWADTLPPGPQRDGAALGLAASVSAAEPEAAWQWAASIGDAALRADAMLNVASAWGNAAPAEFRAAFSEALDHGGYAGAVKAKFLRALDKPSSAATATPPAQ